MSERLIRHLDAATRKRGSRGAPQVLVSAPGFDFSYGELDLPFHVASIGKVPTAVLVLQLVEQGEFTLDTPAADLLPPGTLDGLVAPDRIGTTTVGQLLAHEGGVADYFEGPVTAAPTFLTLAMDEPDRLWTPGELLDFSRRFQTPVRSGFTYSDTGYVLLGVLLEHVTGRAFHDLLHERIFTPLAMDDTYLLYRSLPRAGARPIAPFTLGSVEASKLRTVSFDWAGGGIVSTLRDLCAFSTALHAGRLVTAESLATMAAVRNRFRRGIHYGTGMMELRFEEFFFLLRGLPRPIGHIGVLGTHMFYDAEHEAHIVMNFGGTTEMVRSFRAMIEIESELRRVGKTSRIGVGG
jgi:D-alanyl-D-alanine carboxypeptidase